MRSLIGPVPTLAGGSDLTPIVPENVGAVPLMPASRFSSAAFADFVRENPGASLYSPSTGQYAVCGSWRRRREIGALVELTPGARRARLVEGVVEMARRAGRELLLIDYEADRRERELFRGLGFEPVDEIVEYELTNLAHPRPHRDLPVRWYELTDRDDVLAVERLSFPWLWWNSATEWDRYSTSPSVAIRVMPGERGLIGYASLSMRADHAHLDRLAVARDRQGEGRGAALLARALEAAAERRIRRVTLTTQHDNLRSQRLYRRFGFRPTGWRYPLDGVWLGSRRTEAP